MWRIGEFGVDWNAGVAEMVVRHSSVQALKIEARGRISTSPINLRHRQSILGK
jgi:hypothetical protein